VTEAIATGGLVDFGRWGGPRDYHCQQVRWHLGCKAKGRMVAPVTKITVGKKVWYPTALSGTGEVACGSCQNDKFQESRCVETQASREWKCAQKAVVCMVSVSVMLPERGCWAPVIRLEKKTSSMKEKREVSVRVGWRRKGEKCRGSENESPVHQYRSDEEPETVVKGMRWVYVPARK